MSENLESLVESVGRQVRDFAERIDTEEITDPNELSAFVKLGNYYNRLLESAGKSRPQKKDNGAPDIDQMSDHEFLDSYYAGELNEWIEEFAAKGYGDPSHARLLLIPDETWIEYEGRKPKLIMPVTLNIPL